MARRGRFVVVDGIDGSGKGTLVSALKRWAIRRKLKVLDLRAYGKWHETLPTPEEVRRYEVVVSAEPTFSLVGRAIREEIVQDNRRLYPAEVVADAFSLDRYVSYQRVILPAIRAGIDVFQERSFTSSVTYQPLQSPSVTVRKLLRLPGNALGLRHAPDLFVVADVEPSVALKRLRGRRGKRDNSIFERLQFLTRLRKQFNSNRLRRLLRRARTKVVYLDTGKSKQESEQEIVRVWELFRQGKL